MDESRDDGRGMSLAALYRSVSVEKAPRELDEKILRRARQPARRRTPQFLSSWLPAAALLGAVVVSVAALHESISFWGEAGDGESVVEELSDAAAGAKDRLREFGATPGLPPTAGDRGVANVHDPDGTTPLHCSEGEARLESTWRACIARLEASGRTADAREETLRLRNAYAQ